MCRRCRGIPPWGAINDVKGKIQGVNKVFVLSCARSSLLLFGIYTGSTSRQRVTKQLWDTCTPPTGPSGTDSPSSQPRPSSQIAQSKSAATTIALFNHIMFIPLLALLPFCLAQDSVTQDSVTLYTAKTTPTTSSLAAGATYTGLAAYDPTVLDPPAPPSPPITSYTISIPPDAVSLQNDGYLLSIPQKGNFLGFSIELSVADVVMGKTPSTLKVQFLNYMANIQVRAGQGPIVRVGGNTQEGSTIFSDGLPGGAEIQKVASGKDQYGNSVGTAYRQC
jgi:hypothetical protein